MTINLTKSILTPERLAKIAKMNYVKVGEDDNSVWFDKLKDGEVNAPKGQINEAHT